ncbi:helix-turn-helix domain-containing protein [Klebsiella pneumoniae]|nr:helix-turn-helix domain-containing protein [Klebsiella pneumoniae]
MSLADRVKQKRIELGLTQTEAALNAGITQQSWQSIEKGDTRKPRNIIGIAKALKCDPDWLMNGGAFMPIAEVSSKKVPLISYVRCRGSRRKKIPLRHLMGVLSTSLQTTKFLILLLLYASKAIRWSQTSRLEM